MPRRKRSCTDVYHVVARGNNRQDIFLNNSDKKYIMALIKEKSEKYEVQIYAYCIMSNHLHILLKADFSDLSLCMKQINHTYAIYYNVKYGKCGHVFQGRFCSYCVEEESYLISCIRYIHNNPVRANIISDIQKYPFSSAKEYFYTKKENTTKLISDAVFEFLKNRFRNSEEFLAFHRIFDSEGFIDIEEEKEEYDFQRVKMYIQNIVEKKGIKYINLIENVPFIRKNEIEKCSEKLGLSKRKVRNFLNLVIKNTGYF